MKIFSLENFLSLTLAAGLTGCALSEQPAPAATTPPPAQAVQMPAETTQEGQMVTTKSGLQYIDIKEGTGAMPQKGQSVTVHYTGKLKDGTKFDSSLDRGTPFTFTIGVGQVIKGWDEGVSTMKVGGKRTLIIPSNLGYGQYGAGGVIPPNAELHFDVDLLGIE